MRSILLPSPLVDAHWLHEHLDDVTVLDASPTDARDDAVTIAGAAHFDIDGPLSADDPLPHTMPSAAQFEREVRRLGVRAGAPIVVYDALGLWSSPRARYMFRAMGHDDVAVLDGGLPAWREAGFETVAAVEHPEGDFVAAPRAGMIIGQDETRRALADGVPVLDARSAGRFAGTDPEPRPGLRGGHMPGATSLPFTEILRDGRMLPVAELEQRFPDVDRTVFTCGSGMTACILALGAELAGRQGLQVYDGSWSEWGLPDGPPVERA